MDKYTPTFNWDAKEFYNLLASCETNTITPYIYKYFKKNNLILEAGCGMGQYVKFLENNGYKAIGIEINKKTVQICNSLEPNLNVLYGDVENLNFSDNYFDGILSLGVVEHFIDGPNKPLKEMLRVLKPGGKAIITIPCFNYLRIIKKYTGLAYLDYYLRFIYHSLKNTPSWLYKNENKANIQYKYNRWPMKGDFFEYRFKKTEFENELKKVGFKIIEKVPIENLSGLYFEFGGIFVNMQKPNFIIKSINKLFSLIPFFHNHQYLCIVTK
ncbi:MAG: methyltransferase domain-containing protein [Candidatus Margulisiibacteriota bacterium]|jgi:SAM-dependent methyltransferase